jgi:acyl-CoA thioesterase
VSSPGTYSIEVPRNGSDVATFAFKAVAGDASEMPIDLTGYSLSAKARDVFGGSVIATAVVTVDSAADGVVTIKWVGSQFDSYGSPFKAAEAAWDLKMVDASGIPSIPVRGIITITPEATA